MNLTQKGRLNQVTSDTLIVGVDVGAQTHFCRAFDWRGFELYRKLFKFSDTHEPEIPVDICWLYGSFKEDYLYDVEICQRFAKRSRELMAEIMLNRTGMTAEESVHTIHNYIDIDDMILRKGAISAHEGENSKNI